MSSVFDPNYVPVLINFRIGQKVIVFNSKNEILFLRRSEKVGRAGGWDFPGGALEDETPEEGIAREAAEEAGIVIRDIHPVATVVHDREEKNTKTLMIGYIANLSSDNKVELSWEHDQFEWLAVDEAVKVALPSDHAKFLKAAIEFSLVK